MKYVFTLDSTPEHALKLRENPEEARKAIGELIEQIKPEAMYFSTIRRRALIVVNAEDPHVEIRQIFENLSNWGNVTVDPVSTFEEFGSFLASL